MTELKTLLNLGPRSAERLRAVGIKDVETLEQMGVAQAYQRVKAAFPQQTSLNLLYSLQGGLLGIPWQELLETIKHDLMKALDDEN